MKFSTREKELLSIFKKRKGKLTSFDSIFESIASKYKKQPKHLRKSVTFSIRKLREKLSHHGIDLERVSPVGRGYKAIYKIDASVAKLKL